MIKTRLQYEINKLFDLLNLKKLAADLSPYLDIPVGGGTGDMTKAVYDTNDDGVVDSAATAIDGLKKASNLSDVAVRQTALDNLTNVGAATVEYVLTKDTVSGNAIFKASASGGYTDEQAQDAVGTILLDTNSINLTYVDGAPTIAADLLIQDTATIDLTIDASGLKGDVKAASITEAMQVLADNTTNDVSTTKHGYVPKAPNLTTQFLRGDGTWAALVLSGLTVVSFTTAVLLNMTPAQMTTTVTFA